MCLHAHVNEFKGSNQETAAEDFTSGHLEKEKAEDAVVTENEVTSWKPTVSFHRHHVFPI